MGYIDFHIDTLMMYARGYEGQSLYENDRMVDFKRMKEAQCYGQFFATFFPPEERMEGCSDEEYRANLYEGITREIDKNKDIIAFAGNYDDYLENKKNGRISAFYTFEDGRIVDGKMENLKRFYDLGYRLISLTWNGANCFGFPNSTDPELMKLGLTDFGKESIEVMNELGIIIDVSHLSDGGFYDVAELSKKPFVASHSNARALTPHQRNLTDDMIKILADKGGFCGINFAPAFTSPDIKDTVSTVAHLADHADYLRDKGGIELVGLGSDLDGIHGTLEVGQPTDLYKLFDELKKRGWSDDDIEKFAYKNAERIIKEVL